MEALLLAGAGALFALLLFLNGLGRTIARSKKIGFLDTLLVFMAVLVSIAALIVNRIAENPDTRVQTLTFITIGLLVAPNLLLIPFEARRSEQGLKQSRGILGVGAGVALLIATLLVVPVSADYFFPPPTSTFTSTPQGTPPPPTDTPTITLTFTNTPTRTPTPSPTFTRTPQPTPTASSTRQTIPTRTPEPSGTPVNPCVVVTTNNVNLRAAPATDAELLATIPFETNLAAFGRNDDSTWWFVDYEGQQGWLLGEFLIVSTSCNSLPVRD